MSVAENEKGYYYMSQGFSDIFHNSTLEQQKTMYLGLEHYKTEYKKAKKSTDGISVAYAYNNFLSKTIETALSPTDKALIKCTKGCGFCCYQNVDISDDEAELLATYSKEAGIKINKSKLKRQAKFSRDNWTKQTYNEMACVFLDSVTKECKVYEVRPIGCRKLLVITDPKFCDLRGGRKDMQHTAVAEAEMMASGIMNATKNDSMPKLLLEKL